jgi:hypothetical protein
VPAARAAGEESVVDSSTVVVSATLAGAAAAKPMTGEWVIEESA